jgi:transposase-like protein
MPGKETDPMTERLHFIAAYLPQVYSMTELCERFGIRRHTGSKWVRRDTEPGLAGLQEKSRAPPRCPHRRSEAVAAVRLEAKQAHPPWGRARSRPTWHGIDPLCHCRPRAPLVHSSRARVYAKHATAADGTGSARSGSRSRCRLSAWASWKPNTTRWCRRARTRR